MSAPRRGAQHAALTSGGNSGISRSTAENQRLAKLCDDLQALARRNSNLRPMALEGVEALLTQLNAELTKSAPAATEPEPAAAASSQAQTQQQSPRRQASQPLGQQQKNEPMTPAEAYQYNRQHQASHSIQLFPPESLQHPAQQRTQQSSQKTRQAPSPQKTADAGYQFPRAVLEEAAPPARAINAAAGTSGYRIPSGNEEFFKSIMTEQATPARVRDYANEVFADAMPPPVPQQQYDAAQLPPHAQGYSRSYSQTTPLPPRVRPDPLAFAPAGYAADTGMMAYTAPVPAQPLQQSPITKSTIHFGDSRSEPQHAQATCVSLITKHSSDARLLARYGTKTP
eukprot:TRINITY_DN2134_c0_g1_i5.p1 TRINITY_DN2134_c0_g1~~TRINITY_DN2134_c0_g1_i5.p1  ORF type:complete len:350 (+),score=64.19 TRINITY_DN2134_c0_g1_i5:30-1052(+)